MIERNANYPQFVSNQILTSEQLNDLRKYLDCQDRLSRVRLTGTGIISGLRETLQPETLGISITAGFGISSDGHLIELSGPKPGESAVYTHYRPYIDPATLETEPREYGPWRGAEPIYELLTQAPMENERDAERLRDGWPEMADAALVLYLEMASDELPSCLVTDCNNKGFKTKLAVRTLLVQGICSIEPNFWTPTQVQIPRIHTAGGNDLEQIFTNLIEDGKEPLLSAIEGAFGRYGQLLDISLEGINPAAVIDGLIDDVDQYRYDALKDLASAVNEFTTSACRLENEGRHEDEFPRHFILGHFPDNGGYCSCRSRFQSSAVRGFYNRDWFQARRYGERLSRMLAELSFGNVDGIQIIPSHTEAHPLGRRALPHYFNSENVQEFWLPEPGCAGEEIWTQMDSSDQPRIDSNYNNCTLLRIEGHLSTNREEACERIAAARDAHNLEFDLVCSTSIDTANQEEGLLADLNRKRSERWKIFLEWQNAVSGKPGDSRRLLHFFIEALRDVTLNENDLHREWRHLRGSRGLYCDAASVQADYLQFRASLLCVLHRLLGLLKNTAVTFDHKEILEAAKGGGDPHTPGALQMILDRLASRISVDGDLDAEEFDYLNDVLEYAWIVQMNPSRASSEYLYRIAIELTVKSLIDRCIDLTGDCLPESLSFFNFTLFSNRYKDLVSDLYELRFLAEKEEIRFGYNPRSGNSVALGTSAEVLAQLSALIRACRHPVAALLFELFSDRRAKDFSLAKNFIRTDGLEHRAGVAPGGTFVLISDEDDSVVADFSFVGKLPCCCHTSDTLTSVPPEALPDYWIVNLSRREGEYQPAHIEADCLVNDYSPGSRSGSGGRSAKEVLQLKKESVLSALGAQVDIDPGGLVTYHNPNPLPGSLDRFTYTLQRVNPLGRVIGEDVGHVFVESRLPAELTGSITGVVWGRADEFEGPVPGALVTVSGDSGYQNQLVTGKDGRFEFDSLNAGQYTLQATWTKPQLELTRPVIMNYSPSDYPDSITSDELTVNLNDGDSTDETIFLDFEVPQFGQVSIGVMQNDVLMSKGVTVTLAKTNELRSPRISTQPSADDRYEFDELSPGAYSVGAVAGQYSVSGETIEVVAGEIIELDLQLQLPGYNGFPTDFFGRYVRPAEEDPTHLLDDLNSRKSKYWAVAMSYGRDPGVRTSDVYKEATDFITDVAGDYGRDESSVIEKTSVLGDKLAAASRQARTPETTRAYTRLLATVTHSFMDYLIIKNPDGLSSEAVNVITELVAANGTAGMDRADLRRGWAGDELVEDLNAVAATQIQGILAR